MEQWERWYQDKQVERTINALKKNNFEALFVIDSKAAFEEEILGYFRRNMKLRVTNSGSRVRMGNETLDRLKSMGYIN